jgi:hypothetical protein
VELKLWARNWDGEHVAKFDNLSDYRVTCETAEVTGLLYSTQGKRDRETEDRKYVETQIYSGKQFFY